MYPFDDGDLSYLFVTYENQKREVME